MEWLPGIERGVLSFAGMGLRVICVGGMCSMERICLSLVF